MKTEAEMGVMSPRATEHLEILEATRGAERFSPRVFKESIILLPSLSQISGLQD